jgi:hypothetical protein
LRTPFQTTILSQCPVVHKKCKIKYDRKNGREKEYCMCPCHEHAKPSKPEKDVPKLRIDDLINNEWEI